jgi:CheY-like chemotaxis protein
MPRPFRLMIVDDNPADLYLAEEAILDRDLPCNLHLMPSATAALNQLAEGDHLPDLMLVDVLQHLRVVMFTTSANERDRQRARDHRADGYVVKSQTFIGFQAQLETLLYTHAAG